MKPQNNYKIPKLQIMLKAALLKISQPQFSNLEISMYNTSLYYLLTEWSFLQFEFYHKFSDTHA